MLIDGWKCTELYPGTDYAMRIASKRDVEFRADSDGLRIEESSLGYSGGPGTYSITANVFMWLAQAVRL